MSSDLEELLEMERTLERARTRGIAASEPEYTALRDKIEKALENSQKLRGLPISKECIEYNKNSLEIYLTELHARAIKAESKLKKIEDFVNDSDSYSLMDWDSFADSIKEILNEDKKK